MEGNHMGLMNCPECKTEISDKAKACPNCGYEAKPEKPVRKSNLLKVGAIINVIGGVGFLFMFAILLMTGSGDFDATLSVSVGTADSYSLIYNLAYVFLLIITIVSVALLVIRKPQRNVAVLVAGIQLALAVAALVFQVIAWNLTVCCFGWFVMWGNALQLIGSILCIAGALRLDD